MVFLRAAATWAWLGLLPVVWCLPLDQQQQQQHHQQPQPTLLEDLDANSLPPQDLIQDDSIQQLLARQGAPGGASAAQPSLGSYDASEVLPYMYRLQEGLAGAGLPASGVAGDVTRLENPDWMAVADPRYYLLAQYLGNPSEEGLGSESDVSSGSSSFSPIRKIRNSANTSNSNNSFNAKSSPSSSSSSLSSSSGGGQAKRGWQRDFSRRRSSGLSLSIDASMKVLREALYLEMARKKQRQRLLRARQNQELLTTIGKRDVQRQMLQEGRPEQDHLHAQRI